ncbi:MAG TPA: acetylornithine transaminase [Nocardioides sp.]|uniref:acetylornithine transaminase n=1 Tax=Nocardioides sp. TaxID=35761 RepID=UPI002F3FBFE5
MSARDRYSASLMNTFGPPQLVLTRGKGARVWDEDGNEYVDLLGGIAVNALGHAHPAVVEAVTRQLSTLGHVSNFFATDPQITLAERLLDLIAPRRVGEAAHQGSGRGGFRGKVFLANSGTEANEAALKLTRLTGRTHLVAAEGSFHGRTMGALALTSKAAYREPFEPLPGDVTFVPYGDPEALREAVTDRTAAVVLEPIQGEAGVVEAPMGYLETARTVTRDHGALLWLDEVQTGIGRTGAWLAAAGDPDVAPDVVTLAKGLGGGLPIGACVGLGAAGDLLQPGHHGTTFGGNPVACAAALAVLDTIDDDGLLEHAGVLGERIRAGVADDPRVTSVRGRGLLIGIDVAVDAPRVVSAARTGGFIVNATGPHTLRLAPPLVLGDDEVEQFLAAWPGMLDRAADEQGATA